LLTNICLAVPFEYLPPAPISFCRCNFDWQRIGTESFQQYAVQQPAQALGWSKKRQAEYLAGRYCAIHALGALPDASARFPTTQLEIQLGIQLGIQKDRSAHWPTGTVGSISHSHSRAIAIAARNKDYWGIGVDCETLLSDLSATEIAPWVLHRNDLNCKTEQPLRYGLLITLIFSAKESLFKALSPSDKNITGFGDFSASCFVSKVSANKVFLERDSRHKSIHESRPQRNTQFELAYIIDQQQIITLALLPR